MVKFTAAFVAAALFACSALAAPSLSRPDDLAVSARSIETEFVREMVEIDMRSPGFHKKIPNPPGSLGRRNGQGQKNGSTSSGQGNGQPESGAGGKGHKARSDTTTTDTEIVESRAPPKTKAGCARSVDEMVESLEARDKTKAKTVGC